MTAPKRPAIERAAEVMQSVRDHWAPCPVSTRAELLALTPELLRELADDIATAEGGRINGSR